MRSEQHEKNSVTCHLRYYDDWIDFISFAKQVQTGHKNGVYHDLACRSLAKGEASWFGTASLEEAISLAERGWPEGREKMREIMRRFSMNNLFPHARRFVESFDVFGDECDIDRYLSCVPENMVSTNEAILFQKGKVINLIVDRTNSSVVADEQIIRRGTALVIAFEIMMRLGFTVNLAISFSVENYCGAQLIEFVPILHAGDPVNLDTLAFMFAHPSVLRRLGFAANECESKELRERFELQNGGGYGSPAHPIILPEHDLYLLGNEGLLNHDGAISEFALSIVKRVGIDYEKLGTSVPEISF